MKGPRTRRGLERDYVCGNGERPPFPRASLLSGRVSVDRSRRFATAPVTVSRDCRDSSWPQVGTVRSGLSVHPAVQHSATRPHFDYLEPTPYAAFAGVR